MQNDLISRSALLEEWKNKLSQMGKWIDGGAPVDFRLVIAELENAPAVDAVEVVRCKDCEHWHEGTGWCSCHSHFITPDGAACHPWESANWKMFEGDDFCSYGKRRADDGK